MGKCGFCGEEIAPGTGKLYITKDGTVHPYCSNKCEKNAHKLKRARARVKWTAEYRRAKKSRLATEQKKQVK